MPRVLRSWTEIHTQPGNLHRKQGKEHKDHHLTAVDGSNGPGNRAGGERWRDQENELQEVVESGASLAAADDGEGQRPSKIEDQQLVMTGPEEFERRSQGQQQGHRGDHKKQGEATLVDGHYIVSDEMQQKVLATKDEELEEAERHDAAAAGDRGKPGS